VIHAELSDGIGRIMFCGKQSEKDMHSTVGRGQFWETEATTQTPVQRTVLHFTVNQYSQVPVVFRVLRPEELAVPSFRSAQSVLARSPEYPNNELTISEHVDRYLMSPFKEQRFLKTLASLPSVLGVVARQVLANCVFRNESPLNAVVRFDIAGHPRAKIGRVHSAGDGPSIHDSIPVPTNDSYVGKRPKTSRQLLAVDNACDPIVRAAFGCQHVVSGRK
jgi:hypothetical protein